MILRRVIAHFRKQEWTGPSPDHPGESRDPVLFASPVNFGAALRLRGLDKEALGPGFRRDERGLSAPPSIERTVP